MIPKFFLTIFNYFSANLISASRHGFGELKTEQLGGHSQEQQRHRQAPIDDDDDLKLQKSIW